MTAQRRAVLAALRELGGHPTADEIYARVRKVLPRISLGTVYRNIGILHQCGQALKVAAGGSGMRFDSRVDRHYHIRCLRCGVVADLDVKGQNNIHEVVADCRGFEIVDHTLDFTGLCPECKTNCGAGIVPAQKKQRKQAGCLRHNKHGQRRG